MHAARSVIARYRASGELPPTQQPCSQIARYRAIWCTPPKLPKPAPILALRSILKIFCLIRLYRWTAPLRGAQGKLKTDTTTPQPSTMSRAAIGVAFDFTVFVFEHLKKKLGVAISARNRCATQAPTGARHENVKLACEASTNASPIHEAQALTPVRCCLWLRACLRRDTPLPSP